MLGIEKKNINRLEKIINEQDELASRINDIEERMAAMSNKQEEDTPMQNLPDYSAKVPDNIIRGARAFSGFELESQFGGLKFAQEINNRDDVD